MSAECFLQMKRKHFYNFKKDCTKLLSLVFHYYMLSHIFRKNSNLKRNIIFLDDIKLGVWQVKTKVSREQPQITWVS